jgi:glycine cleavage system protein P-like pyridoxal-binding family
MITYPSTHGVFEVRVKELCALVHRTAAASTSTAPT